MGMCYGYNLHNDMRVHKSKYMLKFVFYNGVLHKVDGVPSGHALRILHPRTIVKTATVAIPATSKEKATIYTYRRNVNSYLYRKFGAYFTFLK